MELILYSAVFMIMLCDLYQESTSSKKAKTDAEEEEAEGSDKSKSEVEDEEEQDGNEVYKIRARSSFK